VLELLVGAGDLDTLEGGQTPGGVTVQQLVVAGRQCGPGGQTLGVDDTDRLVAGVAEQLDAGELVGGRAVGVVRGVGRQLVVVQDDRHEARCTRAGLHDAQHLDLLAGVTGVAALAVLAGAGLGAVSEDAARVVGIRAGRAVGLGVDRHDVELSIDHVEVGVVVLADRGPRGDGARLGRRPAPGADVDDHLTSEVAVVTLRGSVDFHLAALEATTVVAAGAVRRRTTAGGEGGGQADGGSSDYCFARDAAQCNSFYGGYLSYPTNQSYRILSKSKLFCCYTNGMYKAVLDASPQSLQRLATAFAITL
jgi:hypothetical protein